MLENNSRKESERALAASLQQGQPQVLALLYDTYAPVLMGLITRIVRNPQKAEMVLQETFLAIWQKRTAFVSSQCGLLTWMIMLAKETALCALDSKNFNSLESTAKKINSTHENEEIEEKETFRLLEPNDKAALDLIYLKGCSSAEAAATLGISEETLKLKLQMAIKNLRADQS